MTVPSSIDTSGSTQSILATDAKLATETAAELRAEQATSNLEAASSDVEDNYNVNAKNEKLAKPRDTDKLKEKTRVQESVLVRKEPTDLANNFNNKKENQVWDIKTSQLEQLVTALRDKIKPNTPPSEIIKMVENALTINGKKPEAGQVDKALEFLQEVAAEDLQSAKNTKPPSPPLEKELGALGKTLSQTRDLYFNNNKKEITSDRTLAQAIGAVSELGIENLDTPEIRKNIQTMANAVDNPLDLHAKYTYYRKEKKYSFAQIKQEVNTILSCIGQEVKTRNEIPNARINALIQEVKRLQGLLGVVRTSKEAEVHIKRMFEIHGYA